MLVENTEARIISLPSGKSLMPGMNDIPSDEWTKACAHPVISAMLGAGMLKASELSAKAAPAADIAIESLSGLTASEAEGVVGKTFDRELLKTWLGAEKRSKIKKALEAQLDSVKVSAQEE